MTCHSPQNVNGILNFTLECQKQFLYLGHRQKRAIIIHLTFYSNSSARNFELKANPK